MSKNKRIKWNYKKVKHFIEVESQSGCELVSEEYINNSTKIKIRCKCKEIFETTLGRFQFNNKRQCNSCGTKIRVQKRKASYESIKNFVENNSECKLLSSDYINETTAMNFLCVCGTSFSTNMNAFKFGNKRQCNKCGRESADKSRRLSYEDVKHFIEVESESGCKLLEDSYLNQTTKLLLQCKCGNKFKTIYNAFVHANKRTCNDCSLLRKTLKNRTSYDEMKSFIEGEHEGVKSLFLLSSSEDLKHGGCEATLKDIDGYKYRYIYKDIKTILNQGSVPSRFHVGNAFTIENIELWISKNRQGYRLCSKEYSGSEYKIKLLCPHGKNIEMSWDNFHAGKGCICESSKGETKIKDYLKNNRIIYTREHTFDDLLGVAKTPLRFDFAIFKENKLKFLVEYDGEAHFKPVRFGGMSIEKASKKLIKQKQNDERKNQYCKDNNIPLLRIPYWDMENIEQILENELKNRDLL